MELNHVSQQTLPCVRLFELDLVLQAPNSIQVKECIVFGTLGASPRASSAGSGAGTSYVASPCWILDWEPSSVRLNASLSAGTLPLWHVIWSDPRCACRPKTSDILVSAGTWRTCRYTSQFWNICCPQYLTWALLTCGPSTTLLVVPCLAPPSLPLPSNPCSQPSPAFPNSAEGEIFFFANCNR